MDFKVQLAKDVGTTIADAVEKCKDPILEPKYDGWRCIVIREAERVRIFNRSRKEYTGQLPELEADLMKLPVGTILDGELVCMTLDVDTGMFVNDFFRIHTCMRSTTTIPSQRAGIKLVAFDCIAYGGISPSEGPPPSVVKTHHLPLPRRRDYVDTLIQACRLEMVELTTQMPATQENHDSLVELGFEGTVVKCQLAPYAFGKRGHGWFKVKATVTIDVIVMDVIMDGKGQYQGQAGRMAVGQLDGGSLQERAKVNCPDQAQRRAMTDNPQEFIGRVMEMKVYGWHKDGTPRHPTFLRWRDDKDPAECVWSDV